MRDEKNIQAEVYNQQQISVIWIIPILAFVIGGWMLYQQISATGPEITLKVSTAEGIEVGKTEIKSLNVKVGVITDIKLSQDYDYIIIKARMNNDAERMLKDDSQFWIVKPRIGKGGVSGLETLLSGSYIELQPGKSNVLKLDFDILDVPPVAPPDTKGLRILLTHEEAGKLGVGDPIIYKGFTVGRVEKTNFDIGKQKTTYQLFIFEPYDNLVRNSTYFWLLSGVNVRLNAEGFDVELGSIESLISGGVTFGVQRNSDDGRRVTEDMRSFPLFDSQREVRESMHDDYIEFVMLFDESVRGLKAKAPVEYRGLRIGTVMKVPLQMPSNNDTSLTAKQIPVLIRVELDRLYENLEPSSVREIKNKLHNDFASGLRGTLKTGNLLTGALYIDTDYYADEPQYKGSNKFEGYDVYPTKKGGFSAIQMQITDFLKKLNKLPLDDTISSLNTTLKTSERVAETIDELLAHKDTKELPADIRKSLIQIQQILGGYGPDSKIYQELEIALGQFEQVMMEFKPVLRQINEKPNSLLFGEDKTNDPVPVKGK
ncbi:intermembrane transport protein PqiB [Shewanella sp. VB17]|nr:intermembrane transport protein PqiB [Shewanella sp. VB17]